MKRKDVQATFLFVFLGLLFLGLMGFIYYYKSNLEDSFFTYHGFDFKRTQQGYQATIYINNNPVPRTFTLRSDPRDLEDIPVDPRLMDLIQKKEIFITINPYANLTGVTTIAALEIDTILDNPLLYNIPVNATFTEPYEHGGLEVRTCDDATNDAAVLWLKLENKTAIYSIVPHCYVIAGEEESDLILAADRLIYTVMGIMDP